MGVVGCSGGVLLSHDLSVAVPSALEGLASGFGWDRAFPLRYVHRNTEPPPPVEAWGVGFVECGREQQCSLRMFGLPD